MMSLCELVRQKIFIGKRIKNNLLFILEVGLNVFKYTFIVFISFCLIVVVLWATILLPLGN